MLQRLRFVGSISFLYIFTIGTIVGLLQSSHLVGASVQADMPAPWHRTLPDGPSVISGKPTRIAIATAGINVPVSDGFYNPQTAAWTLKDDQAHFAVMTSLANNKRGTTFIYGHGTDAIFGKIGESRPAKGTVAKLQTNSGHTFTYKLIEIADYTPNDTSILKNTIGGKPRLVVQTCTGALSQWRTMFIFEFEAVS